MNPPLTPQYFDDLYSGEYWNQRGRDLQTRVKKQLDRASVISFFLAKWLRGDSSASSLEVGAGYGGVSLGLKKLHNLRATVFDPDLEAMNHAKTAGLEIFNEDGARSQQNRRHFNLLMFVHVLEHQTHPREFLNRWLQYLDIGGLVVVEVPNGQVINHFSLVHPMIFTASGLTRLLRSVGITGKIYRHSGSQNSALPKKYLLFIGKRHEVGSLLFRRLPVPLLSRFLSTLLSNRYARAIDRRILGRVKPAISANRDSLRRTLEM